MGLRQRLRASRGRSAKVPASLSSGTLARPGPPGLSVSSHVGARTTSTEKTCHKSALVGNGTRVPASMERVKTGVAFFGPSRIAAGSAVPTAMASVEWRASQKWLKPRGQ